MAADISPPHYCPECCWLTDEINISVNVSRKTVEDDGEIHYTGDTEFGDRLAPVGHVCPECNRKWIDADLLRSAMDALHLNHYLKETL